MGRGGRLARLGGKDRTSFLGRGAREPRGSGAPALAPKPKGGLIGPHRSKCMGAGSFIRSAYSYLTAN